jgi:hypothetical protein
MENVGNFLAVWRFYGNLAYFVVNWYIFPCCTHKYLAALNITRVAETEVIHT